MMEKECPEGIQSLKRKAPRRPSLLSWVPTDVEQLHHAEKLLFRGQRVFKAQICGLNTLSSARDIRQLDDHVRSSKSSSERTETSAGESPVEAATAWTEDTEAFAGGSGRDALVMIHGFGGGAGNWAQNWEYFSERYDVYAVDLPGFAGSERPKIRPESQEEAMDFICSYIEKWLAVMNFGGPVVLMGHSFGCLVSGTLAMRLGPKVVKMLVFIEPWGVNRGSKERVEQLPVVARLALRSFYASLSPLCVVRGLGPMGPSLLRCVRPDFGRFWGSFVDVDVVYDYIYHCNALEPPTGEYLFRSCCHLDVSAQRPLVDALPANLSKEIPLAVVLGEDSILLKDGVFEMEASMKAAGFRVMVEVIPGASHQVLSHKAAEMNVSAHRMMTKLAE